MPPACHRIGNPPGVLALDGVSLEVARGSCHALVGKIGAARLRVADDK